MAFTNANDLIRLLSNRPLVPFLGAGISVASGFPSIRQLNQYLSKVDFAIEQGVYSHRYASNKADAVYRNHPSSFLLDFGWPEIGQLDADLWQWLTTTTQERDGRTRLVHLEKLRKEDSEIPDWLNHSLPIMDRLSYDLSAVRPADFNHDVDYSLDQRDYLRAIVQYHLRRDLRRLESGADDAALRQWKRWKAFYFGRIHKKRGDESLPDREPDLLYGNWESLLDHLCEGSLDLIDQLFTQLEVGRRPTLAHLYLAFLKQKLDSPLFLTTNFDSFIEQALRQQGLDYRVFDVHRDAQLPDAELVKRQFSLVKLHGSSYGLRLGERLRYPLDSESQNQILRILPRNALVLVMGFSGYERRMLQVLRLVAEQGPVKGRTSDGEIRDDPRIVWLTLEELQGWPGQLQREYQTEIGQIKIADAGTFLQELYFKLGKSFPASQTGYSALTDMVINKASHGTRQLARSEWLKETLSSYLEDSGTSGNQSAQNPVVIESPVDSKTAERINRKKTLKALRQPIHLFIPAALNDWFQSEAPFQQSEHASCAAAEFVKSLGFEYRPIWVSFENHHTVAGVITEFFTKVRAYDPYSPRPPLNLSSLNQEEISHGLEKAVTRILDVFQSGKYVLVLDLMESFGRPQTMHHGVPTYDVFEEDHQKKLRRGFSRRVDEITQFCKLLLTSANVYQGTAAGFGESYLCLTVGGPPSRRFDESAEASSTTENDIRGLLSTVVQEIPRTNQDVCVHRISSYPYTKVKGAGSTAEAAHWMSEAAEGSHIERSSLRLDDARALVQFLTDDTSGDHVPDRVERAFLGLLSVFRRARAIPLIQSVIERWVTSAMAPGRTVNSTSLTQRIQMLLEVIERQNFRLPANAGYIAEYCEGDCIWMYREVRDRMYKSMTEQLSVTKWSRLLSSNGEVTAEDAESASKDGVLAFTWHWAAARTYYADVYRPTQDITAFYEYLYHRISSLRIMTLLKAIICRSKIDTGSLHQLAVELAAFSPLGGYERESFVVSLSRLREEGLTTLHRALVRNRDVLRSSATPSTLKSWARQFLDREIHDLSGSVLADGREDLPFSKIGFGQSEQLAALVECFNRSSAESSDSQVSKSDRQSYLALIGLLEFFDRLQCDGEAADLALRGGKRLHSAAWNG